METIFRSPPASRTAIASSSSGPRTAPVGAAQSPMYVNLGEDQRAQAAYPQSNAGDDAAIVPIIGQPPGLEYQV